MGVPTKGRRRNTFRRFPTLLTKWRLPARPRRHSRELLEQVPRDATNGRQGSTRPLESRDNQSLTGRPTNLTAYLKAQELYKGPALALCQQSAELGHGRARDEAIYSGGLALPASVRYEAEQLPVGGVLGQG